MQIPPLKVASKKASPFIGIAIQATLISYNTLISSLGSCYDSWEKALTLLEELPKELRRRGGKYAAYPRGNCYIDVENLLFMHVVFKMGIFHIYVSLP